MRNASITHTYWTPAILVLLAIAAILAFTTVMTVSAQSDEPDWKVAPTGLNVAAGDAAGELDIAWDAHPQTSKTLSDYRVTWTPDGESFKTNDQTEWYAYPTTNQVSVNGLDAGETYQVRVRARYDDNRKSSWSHVATGQAGVTPNSPATAQPTISGTTEVGETLTAGTSSIDDGNGLSDATFTYQWIRNNGSDTDIADATNSRYTLVDADAEATIKVQVSFTDDDGYPESVTSDATAAVTEETAEKASEEDEKSGTDPRDHQALPWDGHTVHDAKARGERRIQNAGDSVWLSLSGDENHYYWWYYYDYSDSLVPNPKMQFYGSNGQPLVMNGDTVEDTLGSGTRRFNLPRLRLIPDADDTYYMRVSSTSNGTGKFWVYFGDSSITSSRGDRNNSDCVAGVFYAQCKLHAAGTHIEGLIKWTDVDTYKVNFRKGSVARACADFGDDPPFPDPDGGHSGGSDQYAIYDNHGWLFTTDAGVHCTDYFTVDRTGSYVINVTHYSNKLPNDTPQRRNRISRLQALPGKNYTVWYEYQ